MIASLHLRSLGVGRGERVLFEGLDLDLAAGEAAVLTGPNGCGKTSLLRVVAGFISPFRGAVEFAGDGGPMEPDAARRGGLHIVGHQDGLKAGRTGREELLFWSSWCGSGWPAALAAAERLGVSAMLDLEVRLLSSGQRRRLGLARLLAAPRSLWLLDEALAPLDSAFRILFGEVMAAHLSAGGLILAAAHDPLPVAARAVDLGR